MTDDLTNCNHFNAGWDYRDGQEEVTVTLLPYPTTLKQRAQAGPFFVPINSLQQNLRRSAVAYTSGT